VQIFGLEITRARKAEDALAARQPRLVVARGHREPFSGAWQRNEELSHDQLPGVLSNFRLPHADLQRRFEEPRPPGRAERARLAGDDEPGLFAGPSQAERISEPHPVLRKLGQFEADRGNTYVLKRRDGRGRRGSRSTFSILTAFSRLVSDDGQVFYRLSKDNLSAIQRRGVIVPAREIIHDRFNCLFHPLVGISPLYARLWRRRRERTFSARRPARGQRRSPGGILTAPGKIDPENAKRLKETWETQYGGPQGAAKIAILGDGLKFESLTMKAEEAQLIEQLKFTAEMICSVYHVPPYKIGVGPLPSYNNVQALNVEYFSQCLQKHIEDIELCLDEGLGIGEGVSINGTIYGTEFDVDNLLRMDSATQMDVLEKSKGKLTVNEQRRA
jgi:HK97 family phage portal protein